MIDGPTGIFNQPFYFTRAGLRKITIERREAKFNPGKVVMTSGLRQELRDAIPEIYEVELTHFLVTHLRGDWGYLGAEDKRQNDDAVAEGEGGRIFSSYRLSNGTRLWIITEADRSSTTLLRPEDY